MHLKRIQLLGFKSFADRTEILVDAGLTALVGPNGCGKSNISDAIVWALGEQNPRSLRGDRAQDVIFAGSRSRKPIGLAEVQLTLDNSDSTLPISFSEVSVTRRVHRTGESQYFLNGSTCRLKDVIDLFLDTGMGRGAYAIVGQGEIDRILSARPEDRRELVEEAAGIQKYRLRKRDAMRRLESAETNLQRVRDILCELERQLPPLEAEAEVALVYEGLQARLKRIEVGLLVEELRRANYDMGAATQAQSDASSDLRREEGEIARLREAAYDARRAIAAAEEAVQSARERSQAAQAEWRQAEGRAAVAQERSRSIERALQQMEGQEGEAERRRRVLQARVDAGQREAESLSERLEAARESRELAQARAARSELEYQEALRSREARRRAAARLNEERSLKAAALEAAQHRLAQCESQARQSIAELDRVLDAARQEEERRAAAAAERPTAAEMAAAMEAEQERLDEACRAAHAELDGLRRQADGARRELAETASRLRTLRELHQSHEGYYQGVRAVLAASERGEIEGAYRPVADLLVVPPRYRLAIEVALGASAQDLVTATEQDARRAIEWLKQRRAGRATFLPLTLLRPPPALDLRADRAAGVEGVAARLVSAEEEFEPVVRLLLGRVVVAAEMDAAFSLSRALHGWSRIVTLEGELLAPGGALTGGSLQGRSTHLVGRKGEMDDLAAEPPRLEKELSRLAAECDAVRDRVAALEQERQEAQAAAALQKALEAGLAAGLQASGREQARLQAERKRLEEELGSHLRADSDLREEIAGLEAALQEVAACPDDTEDGEDAGREVTEMAARRDADRQRATAAEVEVAEAAASLQAITERMGLDREEASQLAAIAARLVEERAALKQAGADLEQERLQADLGMRSSRRRSEVAAAEAERSDAERRNLAAEQAAVEDELRRCSDRQEELRRSLHQSELRLARLEVQRAAAEERLLEVYGISAEEAMSADERAPLERSAVSEAVRLRREIRAMGAVRTGAIEELGRVSERVGFLDAQRSDLERARESLAVTVLEIDQSTGELFMQTLHRVDQEFQALFSRLFGGGGASLTLSDAARPLESGIEITAQPPGKRPQSLAALSGGERALTAAALIFALLAVKPSPLVVLDEVDAALDGANAERFAELLREYSRRSQFLVVTHNPATIEAAPAWYGITMPEAGVSSVVSYRPPAGAASPEADGRAVVAVLEREPA